MGALFRFAKRCIPNSIKRVIKNKLGIPDHVVLGDGQRKFGSAPVSNPLTWMLRNSAGDDDGDAPIRIAIYINGGMGDYIVYIPIIDQLMSFCECTIDCYCWNMTYCSALFSPRVNLRIMSSRFPIDEKSYDLIFEIAHCVIIKNANYSYIRKKSFVLYSALVKIQLFNDIYAVHINTSGAMPALALRQARFLNMNRWDFLSAGGGFALQDQRSSIFIDMKRFDLADKYGSLQYIIVSRGADHASGGCRQTKVWPKEKYEDFVNIFKKRFPEIRIIQLAANDDPKIAGVDDVIRDAEIEDVKVLLKEATVCVASEGGIAHLAAQISTSTVVVFGPTPEYYYGYKRNVNIVSPFCSDCMMVIPNWYVTCPKGFSEAQCMEAISGEMVADAVSKIFNERKSYHYVLEDLRIYSSQEFLKFERDVKDIVKENSMTMKDGNGHIYGPSRTYIHASKRWEHPYILEQINAKGKRQKIADVGSGRGALSLYLAKNGHDVTVYDMDFNYDGNGDSQAHNRFMRYCAENKVRAKIATGFNLPEGDDSFDVVVSTSVIEHVVNKKYMLKEMLRIIKPGGILILTYDLAPSECGSEINSSQIEVLTPSMFKELLTKLGIAHESYDEYAVEKSKIEIASDIPLMHPDLTVGGCVIRKMLASGNSN